MASIEYIRTGRDGHAVWSARTRQVRPARFKVYAGVQCNGAVVVGNDNAAVAGGAGVGDQGSRNIAVVVASDAEAKAFNRDNNIAIAYGMAPRR
ncbi:MAG: hypothetical protein QOH91_131 [Mycobacterium sp.]|nr:hypothetical protein [Mycobacterium sp.]